MPMEAQTRLLRVLQQGEYTTVGGRTPIKTNVRIVAATNKDLRISIQQGLFREDLFFRLNVVPLRLPPLRERAEDIPDLVRHFFAHRREGGPAAQASRRRRDRRLKRYRWPGNVRELENLVRRLAALYPQETITEPIIDTELAEPTLGPAAGARRQPRADDESLSGSVERHLADYFAEFKDDAAAARPLPPHPARGRRSADRRGAGRHPRQPDQAPRSFSASTATRCARRSATSTSRSSARCAEPAAGRARRARRRTHLTTVL